MDDYDSPPWGFGSAHSINYEVDAITTVEKLRHVLALRRSDQAAAHRYLGLVRDKRGQAAWKRLYDDVIKGWRNG